MASPDYKFKITTPFAEGGLREDIPEVSQTTEMSLKEGYTNAYQKKPDDGGRHIKMSQDCFYACMSGSVKRHSNICAAWFSW